MLLCSKIIPPFWPCSQGNVSQVSYCLSSLDPTTYIYRIKHSQIEHRITDNKSQHPVRHFCYLALLFGGLEDR